MSVALRTITRLQDADDINVSLGVGVDEYALCWDNDTAKFVLRAVSSGSYLLATGATTGATSQRQAFTNGISTPSWRPGADSTTALQIQSAASATIVTIDTTNSRVGINTTPGAQLHIHRSAGNNPAMWLSDADVSHPFTAVGFNPEIIGSVISVWSAYSGTAGGFVLTGLADSDSVGAAIAGMVNSASPTQPATAMIGWKTDGGNGRTAMAGADKVTQFRAGTTVVLTVQANAYVGIGTDSPSTLLHGLLTSAATNAVTNVVTIGHDTSGTAANGFGAGQLFTLESSTTAAQNAARIQALWNDATHATRKADLVLSAYDTSEREGLRIRGAGSAPALGFYGVSPIERATLATGAGASVDDVITALQNLGLVKQS